MLWSPGTYSFAELGPGKKKRKRKSAVAAEEAADRES